MASWRCSTHIANARGELAAGAERSAVWVTRLVVDELAAVLLAAVDETSPSQRWRVRLLDRRRDRLGDRTVDAVLDALFLTPGAEPAAQAERVLAFAQTRLAEALETRPDLARLLGGFLTGSDGLTRGAAR